MSKGGYAKLQAKYQQSLATIQRQGVEMRDRDRQIAACLNSPESVVVETSKTSDCDSTIFPRPLERSSIEAYLGFTIGIVLSVVTLTWWIRVVFFFILAFVGADFCWRSPFTFKWRSPLKYFAIVGVVSWVGWGAYSNVKSAYDAEEFPANVRYMTAWGGVPGVIDGAYNDQNGKGGHIEGDLACDMRVAGSKLMKFSGKYRLWAVCYHRSGYLAQEEVAVSGSAFFDILDEEIDIKIPWNKQYQSEFMNHAKQTDYVLLIVPKGTKNISFTTIKEAEDQGSKIIETNYGPP